MQAARAPWWARTPVFGNLGAPIIRKEVYSLVRRNRWFWAQFIYLVVIAAGMTIIHVSTAYSGVPAEDVGAALVTGFFSLQLGLVFLIFPGLAATAITSERVEKSFDLLAVSDLSPVEIVWGKLIGILGSAGYFIVSTLPILGVCIFFGGLSPLSIAIDYAFLLLVALVLSSWGILVSSICKGNVVAIIATYALALLVGSLVVPGYVQMGAVSGARGIREIFEQIPPRERGLLLSGAGSVIATFVGACLVGAVFSLSPVESSRGTAVRVYLVGVLGVLFAFLAGIVHAVAAGWFGIRELPTRTGIGCTWVLGTAMFVVLVALAGSRVETPLSVVRGAARRPLRMRLAWPFLGGGVRGWVLAAAFLALGLCGWVFVLDSATSSYLAANPNAKGFWRGVPLAEIHLWSAEVFAAWIFAHISLAFLLASGGVKGALNFFLTAGVAVLLLLYSASALAQRPPPVSRAPEAAVVAPAPILSPILGFMEIEDGRVPASTALERSPATAGHWIAGAAFLLAGLATLRVRRLPALRLARPGYEFLSGASELPEVAPPASGGASPGLE